MQAKIGAEASEIPEPLHDHTDALKLVSRFLADTFSTSFNDTVTGVGHRVVHGLHISDPVLVTPEVKDTIRKGADLAPLHNPANLMGIEAAEIAYTKASHVAVFDTAFHATLPERAYLYALPRKLIDESKIRRYGFHGTSYKYLTDAASAALGKAPSELNAILLHLGAGSSMCAVKGGHSIETTMGLTPLAGLVMGTRSGDVDPAIVGYLTSHGRTAAEADKILNKESGFLGLTGTSDVRVVLDRADEKEPLATAAMDVFTHRVCSYVAAYTHALEGKVDALVFSAGIGENAPRIRTRVAKELAWAGVKIDEAKNQQAIGVFGDITAPGSSVKVLVVPTDEELSIAIQTHDVIAANQH